MSDKDNVVQFPGKHKVKDNSEDMKTYNMEPKPAVHDQSLEDEAKVIQAKISSIKEARTKMPPKIDLALAQLDATSGIASEANVEGRLRALESAVRSLSTLLRATDGFVEFVARDNKVLGILLTQQRETVLLTSLHSETLKDSLKSKGLVTEEELAATWEKLTKEMQEETPPKE